ncbi:alpha/beta fold hydrolase [Bordetella petrii]|uniref:alpha/beta fold hydrolase n=1 Tax=Bordetella petrii TaxID=94624 RepID=UPI001E542966|nr:alpha/beta hydrolase [Bordetella petrii]MCD0504647.1 alpha/beta hydrolase [Bordetella petrii]
MSVQKLIAALSAFALFALCGPSAAAPSPPSRFTVTVEGQGPDVILVPGLGSSREVWRGLAAGLAQTHRLHLVQIAGFAGVPAGANAQGPVIEPVADALADYIAAQGLQAPAVVGHSLGGAIALMLGARHAGQVGRVVVVDALPFYSLLMNPSATAESMQAQAKAAESAMLDASPEQLAAMQEAAIARLVKTESARPALVQMARDSDRQVFARATYELMVTDLRPELAKVAAPTLVIYSHDPAYGIGPERVDAWYRSLYGPVPAVTYQRIDDSFHFIMLDQPAAFDKAVEAFLR